jgi:sialate O-acetylesterase
MVEYDFPAILRDWKNNDFIQQWVRERAQLNVNKAEDKQQRHPYEPCYLYESGIDPLNNFPIKGVIWYQGESNAHNKDAHSKLFEMLVKSWRHNWGDMNMPFYFVQLSSIDRPSWPWFRDSQRRLAEKLDNVEMVVSSDKGDSLDVHPRAKKEIGDRLGYVALNKTYGHNVVPSGPMYKSVEFKNGEAVVSFDYGNGLKTSDGGAPICFEIAADDDLFFSATARIDGDKIILKSDKVKKPRKVRYAWQPFTRANLVNGAGLPASTFITD